MAYKLGPTNKKKEMTALLESYSAKALQAQLITTPVANSGIIFHIALVAKLARLI